MTRAVFYVSDGTGITVETIGQSLLTQFPQQHFTSSRISFVTDEHKARAACERIRKSATGDGRAIVVHSIVSPDLIAILSQSGALMLDAFAPFIAPLEAELRTPRQLNVGLAHAMADADAYFRRIDAINFTLAHDDGVAPSYDEADLVLVAVSRAGKTPTCIYLALHYGLRAANYPLTEEDLERDELPARLRPWRKKLFGLTIDATRLQQVRQVRRPDSPYARLETCRREVAAAEALFARERIPTLSTTFTSIEEIASKVISTLGLHNAFF